MWMKALYVVSVFAPLVSSLDQSTVEELCTFGIPNGRVLYETCVVYLPKISCLYECNLSYHSLYSTLVDCINGTWVPRAGELACYPDKTTTSKTTTTDKVEYTTKYSSALFLGVTAVFLVLVVSFGVYFAKRQRRARAQRVERNYETPHSNIYTVVLDPETLDNLRTSLTEYQQRLRHSYRGASDFSDNNTTAEPSFNSPIIPVPPTYEEAIKDTNKNIEKPPPYEDSCEEINMSTGDDSARTETT